MDLTLRRICWVKFCMKLIVVISHDNITVKFIIIIIIIIIIIFIITGMVFT
jgi:hypothetical protein